MKTVWPVSFVVANGEIGCADARDDLSRLRTADRAWPVHLRLHISRIHLQSCSHTISPQRKQPAQEQRANVPVPLAMYTAASPCCGRPFLVLIASSASFGKRQHRIRHAGNVLLIHKQNPRCECSQAPNVGALTESIASFTASNDVLVGVIMKTVGSALIALCSALKNRVGQPSASRVQRVPDDFPPKIEVLFSNCLNGVL